MEFIQANLVRMLRPYEKELVINMGVKPYIILVIGVNGSGKTTTIGKITNKLQAEGKSVILAAGDTFRAAAVDQLKVWGIRNKVPVIFQSSGFDSASVIYDSIKIAKSHSIDVVIADTSGRLHTKDHLMNELKKIVRVIKTFDIKAPHEILLVVDACLGQNSIIQTQAFNNILPITGIVVTKLDGTARGGVIFSIIDQLSLPIKFICAGENIEDLYSFDSYEFVKAIFSSN
jgi:fused signal recognition particle receptor